MPSDELVDWSSFFGDHVDKSNYDMQLTTFRGYAAKAQRMAEQAEAKVEEQRMLMARANQMSKAMSERYRDYERTAETIRKLAAFIALCAAAEFVAAILHWVIP